MFFCRRLLLQALICINYPCASGRIRRSIEDKTVLPQKKNVKHTAGLIRVKAPGESAAIPYPYHNNQKGWVDGH